MQQPSVGSRGAVATVSAGLAPYQPSDARPWDARRAAHLLRRTGFRAEPADVRGLLEQDPLAAVDAIVDDGLALALPEPPEIASLFPPPATAPKADKDAYSAVNVEAARHYRIEWLRSMYTQGLREKMALFWSNHFVTQLRIYFYTAYAHQYLSVIRTHGLGDFKQFVYDIGLTPAMVDYLDGRLNRKGHPNENYARELLELFTVGLDNYTQADIAELARALTGWADVPHELRVVFNPAHHDDAPKTIFGKTGSFDYDGSIDLIFAERGTSIARFICGKLYRYFVYAEEDEAVVDAMADLFVAENFQIAPVLRALFKSAHFMDDAFIGARIKSPVELLMSMASLLDLEGREFEVFEMGEQILRVWDQVPLDPPNVGGWNGNRSWITSGTLVNRWNFCQRLFRFFDADVDGIIDGVEDPSDPEAFARALAERLLGKPPSEAEAEEYTAVLLGGTPAYAWNPYAPAARGRVTGYLLHLIEVPAFQLT